MIDGHIGTCFVDQASSDSVYVTDVVELFEFELEAERMANLQRAGEAKRVKKQKKLDDERIEKERGEAVKKVYDDKEAAYAEAIRDKAERLARGEVEYLGILECPDCRLRWKPPHQPKARCPECGVALENQRPS